MWLPDLSAHPGPKYRRIVDAMSEDICSGQLAVGERLPTHRDLAWRLGVTVGTVTRAYAEAERRGLLIGEVGRGSFVRGGAFMHPTVSLPEEGAPRTIELGINRVSTRFAGAAFARALETLAGRDDLDQLLDYHVLGGMERHRAAGARWVGDHGLAVSPDRVIVTNGAQHAIAACLMSLSDPATPVLVESLTWTGTRALATLLRMPLRGVALDDEGVMPDALDAAARSTGANLVYLQPAVQNPTTGVMSDRRRRDIAEVARRNDLIVIEDHVYGMIGDEPVPPIAAYAPANTIYLTSASKCMAPGLRAGFAVLPADLAGRFSAAARAVNWMAPPAMAEVLSQWIDDGTAAAVAREIRRELDERKRVARRVLNGVTYRDSPLSFHIWLPLAEPWRAREAVVAARGRGLSLMDTELFVPGREPTPHAVRVSITGPRDCAELERGLTRMLDLLAGQPEPRMAVA